MDSSSSLRSVHKELQSQLLSPDTTVSGNHIVPTASSQETTPKAPPVPSTHPTVTTNSKKRKTPPNNGGGTSGRWTPDEHEAFLRGLSLHGREWKRVAADIPTRTSSQVRSHAQKYFAKLSKYEAATAHGGMMDWDSSCGTASVMSTSSSNATLSTMTMVGSSHTIASLPPSVQRQAERIIADPGSVEAEVKETLQQLKTRYAQLQQRLQQQQPSNDERIALDVLRGGLSHP